MRGQIQPQVYEISDPWLSAAGFHVFTTTEGANPGGSVKDHMVLGALQSLLQQNKLRENGLVSEVSAGSTALSLAYYARELQLRAHLFLPFEAPTEIVTQLKSLGASVTLCDRHEAYALHEKFCVETQSLPLNQLWDEQKKIHYHALGQEIQRQVGAVEVILGAVGTGHSLKGTHEGLGSLSMLSVEPLAPWRVNGVRNIDTDRYGDQDPCRPKDFAERILISSNEAFPYEKLATTSHPLRIGDSFKLVLGGVRKLMKSHAPCRILALGANNRLF